jgi:Na+-driven multidrug efflux pump
LLAVFVGFYGLRLGCGYLVTYVLEWNLFWLWFALIGDYVARAALKSWRFASDHWLRLRI